MLHGLILIYIVMSIGVPCFLGSEYTVNCHANRMFGAPDALWPYLIWAVIALIFILPAAEWVRDEWKFRDRK